MIWNPKDILYEDQHILVCRKHAGMAVQSARIGQMDMESALRNYLNGGFVGIVQRLDQPVEGVLVFGKSSRATAELNRQQQNGKMKKTYLAAFTGRTDSGKAQSETMEAQQGPENVRLEDFLVKNGKTNTSAVVPEGTPGAKRAVLFYKILKTEELPGWPRWFCRRAGITRSGYRCPLTGCRCGLTGNIITTFLRMREGRTSVCVRTDWNLNIRKQEKNYNFK